ncbi:MAG TPA: decarboxylase [Candidatus Paceibacterota bacterium]|nr:decarboxylase [Candidatus Paceibacterota bacterium]
MNKAKFILSKKIAKNKVETLKKLGLKVSYSYKTNKEVGNVLQKICPEVNFSIHEIEEIDMIDNKNKIWFFIQAESNSELEQILNKGVRNFVIDNKEDLDRILKVIFKNKIQINLSLRMKFQEHRIGTGKYFVYGLPSRLINELVEKIKDNQFIKKLGIHVHRKTQNTSEWDIKNEIQESLNKKTLKRINFLNLGGGLPSMYRSYISNMFPYIFERLIETKTFLDKYEIETMIEPGRFISAESVVLETEIIQIQEKTIVVNTSIYNCALDTTLTGTKMLVKGELSENDKGEYYLIKGKSPTRDDIFRYKVKLKKPKVGDKIIFLNAGAYNYTTDFCCLQKLKTEITENF